MKIRITNLSVTLDDERPLEELIAERLKVSPKKIHSVKIIRQAVDARRFHGAPIKFNYIVEVEVEGKFSLPHDKNIKKVERLKGGEVESRSSNHFSPFHLFTFSPRQIVVGFGPAGMFAALTLAEAGLQPIIFERGEDVDSRTKSVEKFFHGGELNQNSNVQFGEGGAGTFSDGKLTTRINDSLID